MTAMGELYHAWYDPSWNMAGITQTARQKKAINIIVENQGNIGVSTAMRLAGYSPVTAKNPSYLTKSKAWKELMEEFISEDLLAKVHNDLLKETSYKARTSALDMGYKLRGKYAAEKHMHLNVDVSMENAGELLAKADSLGLSIIEDYAKPIGAAGTLEAGGEEHPRLSEAVRDQDGEREDT